MNNIERNERLQKYITEDRIIRRQWRDVRNGREFVCLLAALSPEVCEAEQASACPADVMPQWLAWMTPNMDDHGSDAAWPGMIRRYADVTARWHVLSQEDWRRLDFKVRAICVLEAMSHTQDKKVLSTCQRVVDLCHAEASGAPGTAKEWDRVRAAMRAMEEAAAAGEVVWAASAASAAAAEAAEAEAAWAASAASVWAASAASVWAAEAAEAAEAEAAEAAEAEAEAAWDRITDATLAAIETACAKAAK